MQHTLIPYKDRRRLHREYILRVITVAIFGATLAVLVGMVAMFPAYIRAWFYNYAAQNAASVAKLSKPDASLELARTELARDGKLLSAASASLAEVMYSDIVKSLLSSRGRVSITNFSVTQTDPDGVSINIKGIAPTRDDLIAFKGRLEAIIPGTRIEIPIDQLARNTNLQYNLRFAKKM